MLINKLSDVASTRFRDELRAARAQLLENTENFGPLVQVIESLGQYLHTSAKAHGLGHYQLSLLEFVETAFEGGQGSVEEFNAAFRRMYALVKDARNDLMHTGVYARNVADRAGELAIILEDALNSLAMTAGDLMVPNPLCAETWQSVSMVRKMMLLHSYSFLPIQWGESEWRFISDFEIAVHLRSGNNRNESARKRIGDLRKELFPSAKLIDIDMPISDLLKEITREPVLVIDKESHIVGIITAFDLL